MRPGLVGEGPGPHQIQRADIKACVARLLQVAVDGVILHALGQQVPVIEPGSAQFENNLHVGVTACVAVCVATV